MANPIECELELTYLKCTFCTEDLTMVDVGSIFDSNNPVKLKIPLPSNALDKADTDTNKPIRSAVEVGLMFNTLQYFVKYAMKNSPTFRDAVMLDKVSFIYKVLTPEVEEKIYKGGFDTDSGRCFFSFRFPNEQGKLLFNEFTTKEMPVKNAFQSDPYHVLTTKQTRKNAILSRLK